MPVSRHAIQVSDNIRAEMARAKFSQESLAEPLGMTQQALSRRLAGHVEFRVTELQRIAAVLGVPIATLINDPERAAS